jgi:hypothetical protein
MKPHALMHRAALMLLAAAAPAGSHPITPAQAREIARDAYIWGFPLVDNYRIQYAYFVDRGGKEYKTTWNTLFNTARVYTPEDTAIQTPNSDTPYSFIGADLRTEPLVFTVPAIEKNRYVSLQFVDLYTYNFAYVGSRATGNGGGHFLLAGPGWEGQKPEGIDAVIRSETELAFVVYRTQLFDAADIENVKKVQAGYKVEPLSHFLGAPAPGAAPPIDFIEPLSAKDERTSVDFFGVLDFVLGFCPADPSEKALRDSLAHIGVGGKGRFDAAKLSTEMREALAGGIADAWKTFGEFKETQVDTGKRTSADLFGTRAYLKGDYLARMAGAVLGIYGNSKDEAFYPAYTVDADRRALDGSHRYTLHFAKGATPPANAFWSLTLYEMPQSLLYANPLNRYLINSPMLPTLAKDADGSITLYIQHASPGKDKESNWLPAPAGPFVIATRIYWPKPEALNGTWKAPPLERKD